MAKWLAGWVALSILVQIRGVNLFHVLYYTDNREPVGEIKTCCFSGGWLNAGEESEEESLLMVVFHEDGLSPTSTRSGSSSPISDFGGNGYRSVVFGNGIQMRHELCNE